MRGAEGKTCFSPSTECNPITVELVVVDSIKLEGISIWLLVGLNMNIIWLSREWVR